MYLREKKKKKICLLLVIHDVLIYWIAGQLVVLFMFSLPYPKKLGIKALASGFRSKSKQIIVVE